MTPAGTPAGPSGLSQAAGRLSDMEATSLRFAAAARTLGHVARQQGLQVPGFRSPPRIAEVDRTLRRRPDGGALVAVRLKGRPWVAVLADMIDGMIATNYLDGADAARFRTRLWTAVETDSTRSVPPTRAQRLARVRAATTPSFNPVADQSQVA